MNKLLKEQINKYKKDYKYSQARKLLNNDSLDADELRALAECYYKDLELNKNMAYSEALEILNKIKIDNKIPETLCLKGALHKRLWEHQANLDDLYKAIDYYEEAYREHKTDDRGYGGINASYLYDILAKEVKKVDKKYSIELEERAYNIRIDIIESFKNENDEWLSHTLAQAYLGTNDLDGCKTILQEASENYEYSDWQIFTTYKQLKLLADLKNITDLDCLVPLLGKDAENILKLSLDKKGLALSGGGFRASFFELGTLAKLAECNLLKDIEVISTVSGGSIVGVHYYLKLQVLLESKSDEEITHDDYIELVRDLMDEFYDVVQTDIRNSVIWSSALKTLKYLNPFSSYTRTERLGELYQERIYDKYNKHMRDLIITPKGFEDKQFRPRFNNWRRKNKVPILVINSTNLNSGHNWQFQATKMGEPQYVTNLEIDKNNRFDWVRYESAGLEEKFKNYSIGQAVASSSAVPMLFAPIIIDDLYDGYKLSVSDGGVYDNQGFSGLLSEECDFIICSDASGQMDNQKKSATTIVGMTLRSTDIQMDRNRELIYEDLKNKKDKGILKGFIFTHLKQGLKAHDIKHSQLIQEFENGSDKEFQELIANIRTDLDKFSKITAYALIYNGYQLLEDRLDCKDEAKKEQWVFLDIKKDVDSKSKKLVDELRSAQDMIFRKIRKWWRS